LNSTGLNYLIRFTKNITANFTLTVKKGLNEYKLTERLLVKPSYSIYWETNDPYLLSYILINKTESTYNNLFINKPSDLVILNDTFVYDLDQNKYLMFSFKVDIDYLNFTETIPLNTTFNLPGYYGIMINYDDPSNNMSDKIDLNVISSNSLFFEITFKFYSTFIFY
jgi:hypothetical protein